MRHKSRLKRFYGRHFLWIEVVIPALATYTAWHIVNLTVGWTPLEKFLSESRHAAYGAIASITGSLLGFVLASISIVMVFGQMPRLRLLRQSGQYARVFDIFFQAINWLAFATVWAFVGLLVDTDRSPCPIVSCWMVFFLLVAAGRMYRCVWILKQVASIAISKIEVTQPDPESASH